MHTVDIGPRNFVHHFYRLFLEAREYYGQLFCSLRSEKSSNTEPNDRNIIKRDGVATRILVQAFFRPSLSK